MKLINKEYDPSTRITTETYYDPDTDSLSVNRVADVEPNLDRNKRQFNDAPSAMMGRWKDNLVEVADIDCITIEKWLKEGFDVFASGPEADAELKRRLNDPNNRYLRTRPGRI